MFEYIQALIGYYFANTESTKLIGKITVYSKILSVYDQFIG